MALTNTRKRQQQQAVEVTIPDDVVVSEPEEDTQDAVVDQNVIEIEPEEEEVEVSAEKMVRIRMRVDHNCCIAMERYNLKAGEYYNVPSNVKDILNRAGLLSPL